MNRLAPWLIALSLTFSSVCFGQVTQEPIEAEPASLVTLESDHEGRWIPGTTFDASATDRFEAKVWPDRKSAVIAAGLPGTVRVVVLIPNDVAQDFVTFTVRAKGAPQPPVPPQPPGPNPPGPNPPPDVAGVAKAVRDMASGFSPESKAIATPVANIYSRAAQKLRDRSETNISALLASVKADVNALYATPQLKADWSKLSGTISPAWDAMYANNPTLDTIADFLAQISIGLEGVR